MNASMSPSNRSEDLPLLLIGSEQSPNIPLVVFPELFPIEGRGGKQIALDKARYGDRVTDALRYVCALCAKMVLFKNRTVSCRFTSGWAIEQDGAVYGVSACPNATQEGCELVNDPL